MQREKERRGILEEWKGIHCKYAIETVQGMGGGKSEVKRGKEKEVGVEIKIIMKDELKEKSKGRDEER